MLPAAGKLPAAPKPPAAASSLQPQPAAAPATSASAQPASPCTLPHLNSRMMTSRVFWSMSPWVADTVWSRSRILSVSQSTWGGGKGRRGQRQAGGP